jgi:hypothetical protein
MGDKIQDIYEDIERLGRSITKLNRKVELLRSEREKYVLVIVDILKQFDLTHNKEYIVRYKGSAVGVANGDLESALDRARALIDG